MNATRWKLSRYPYLNAGDARQSLLQQRVRLRWVGLYLVVGAPIFSIGFFTETPAALAVLFLIFMVGGGAITLWANLGVPVPDPDADIEAYRRLARSIVTRSSWAGIGLSLAGGVCWIAAVLTIAWEHTDGLDQFAMILVTVLVPALGWVSVLGVRDPDGVARGHIWPRPRVRNGRNEFRSGTD